MKRMRQSHSQVVKSPFCQGSTAEFRQNMVDTFGSYLGSLKNSNQEK